MELERSSLIFLYDSWEALKFIQDVSVMFASLVCKRNHFCGSFKPLKFNKIIKYRQNRCLCDFHTLECQQKSMLVWCSYLFNSRDSQRFEHTSAKTRSHSATQPDPKRIAAGYCACVPLVEKLPAMQLAAAIWPSKNASRERFFPTNTPYRMFASIVLQTRLKNTSIIHDTTTTLNSHLYNCNGSWRRNQAR